MKDLWTSASQLETHGLCSRKWWFNYVKRLPTLPKTHFAFGTILHEVCERYLKADYLGCDESGNPVDLYPEGWQLKDDYELTPVEQSLVKSLVDRAIEEGILVRQGGEVEAEIKRKMADGIMYVGKIDHLCPDGIEDHKTTKSTRWALSPQALAKNKQVLLYAREWLERKREAGESIPEKVRLQHNVFIKDPEAPQVRKTVAYVEPADIDNAWNNAIDQAKQMVLDRQVENWTEFSDPEAGACMKYGGCEFRSICGRRESMERYVSRLESVKNRTPQPSFFEKVQSRQAHSNENQMALKKRIAERARPFVQINTPVEPEDVDGESAEEPSQQLPPWASAGCVVCSKTTPGFNSSGKFCRACLSKTDFDVSEVEVVTVDNQLRWATPLGVRGTVKLVDEVKAAKPSIFEKPTVVDEAPTEDEAPQSVVGTIVHDMPPLPPDYKPRKKRKSRAKNPLPEPDVDPNLDFEENDDDDEPFEVPEDETDFNGVDIGDMDFSVNVIKRSSRKLPKTHRKPAGRPPAGPKLLIGVMPVKGIPPTRIQLAQTVLQKFGDMLAKHKNVPSYYSLPAYERRSALAMQAAVIADAIGTDYVMVTNPDNPDIESLVSALIPFCQLVFSR